MKSHIKSQKKIPYISSVASYVKEHRIPFHIPGHKQGKGMSSVLHALWGSKIFKYDLTEVDGLDYLNAPTGIIVEAEKLAAQAFGAEHTLFLTNGSTLGNQVSILSLVKEGQKILIPRNSHQSVFSSLILSGAHPIYLQPTHHPLTNLYPTISINKIEKALKNNKNVKAIHITSPNYNGFVSDIKTISNIAKKENIPLIVDEAHGAHFQFHSELPVSAINYDADIVIHSTHKTLGSLTQTSMLHLVKSDHVSIHQLQECLMVLQSSSPSTLFIMSLDAARQQMAIHGKELLNKTLQLARHARQSINNMNSYHCYGKEIIDKVDVADIDETKLFIDVSKTGYTGYELEKILGRNYHIEVEMSDAKHILCFITIGDTARSIEKLLKALNNISNKQKNFKQTIQDLPFPKIPELIMLPKEAFFSNKKSVPLSQALGEVSGEFIIPFPPDVPIIAPGERINREILEYVKYIRKSGIMLVGPKDSSLESIQIIK